MCYDDNAQPPIEPGSAGSAHGEDLVLTASDGNQFAAYHALPSGTPTALILVLPDVRGLHQFYKDLALRFAEAGVAAVAMDYFGRTAGLTSRAEGFEFMPHVQQLTLEGVYGDAAASLAHGHAHAGHGLPAFSVGFCLGGTLSFLAGAEPLGLSGVIGFYAGMARSMGGRGTLLERAGEIKVPALGLFGGADQGIPPEQVQAFDQALDANGVPHDIRIYEGATHSFFDRRQAEFAEASADAWKRVLSFIETYSREVAPAA